MFEHAHDSASSAVPPPAKDHRVLHSMIHHVLPTVLSNRLPTLPSIRRSISDMRERSYAKKEPAEEETPGTPPPGYTSRPGSGSATPDMCGTRDGEMEGSQFPDHVSERLLSSPFATGEGTGVNWKYARQGVNLMTQAYSEYNSPLDDIDESSASLTRQLYLHGMSYLLRGLPSDLTPQETLGLQAAMPPSVATTQEYTDSHALVARCEQAPVPVQHDRPPQPPSVVHRVTAALVLQVFILAQLLLPYIKICLAQAYQFEREHQITRRVVSGGVTAVDDIGRRGLRLSQAICQMNDGKVGQAINEMVVWWVAGVTGGVQQGVEAGLRLEGRTRAG